MRTLLSAIGLSVLTLLPSSSYATDRPRQIAATPNTETYRGYYIDTSEIARRQNFRAITDALRHQLDIVESVGLSPRVLDFFRTVPIVAGEVVCLQHAPEYRPDTTAAACFGQSAPERLQRTTREFTVWDSEKLQWTNPNAVTLAEDTQGGAVMVRPLVLGVQEPVMLHEMLHAYQHHHMLSNVPFYYDRAKSESLYPADAYFLTNEREFFAVTASVFLYGKGDKEPFTRSNLKEKQPAYFNYLVWLFGIDPDRVPSASPVASVGMSSGR